MLSNEALEAIRRRKSARVYAFRQVQEEALISVVDAGRHAPYASEGLRYFAVVQDRDVLEAINLAAKEVAAQMENGFFRTMGSDPRFHSFYKAPTLVLVCAPDRDVSPEMDCAAASQNILIASESLGLGACWAYFPLLAFYSQDGPELLHTLQLPQGYRPYTAIALGYRREPDEEPPMRRADAVTFI